MRVINGRPLLTLLLLMTILGAPLRLPARASDFRDLSLSANEPQQSDPAAALSRGRTMLRQGHADQALGNLQTALNLYTQANNSRGIAATEDALGDLYMIQGQYPVALDHFQKA